MKYGEITHFSHPWHRLRFEYVELPFKCDGCKEAGIGSRYKCTVCDYDLHKHCALPVVGASVYHPFYSKCRFQFMARPPGNIARYCNACEKDVNGFVYHCRLCGFDLHPCCANLPHVLEAKDTTLYLHRKARSRCHRCGRKGKSWSYRSRCKKYNLHVACVMDILVESWHDIYFDSNRCATKTTTTTKDVPMVPLIRGTRQSHHRKSRGKVKSCCEMAATAVQFVISAVLGDPTAIIAGVVAALISK